MATERWARARWRWSWRWPCDHRREADDGDVFDSWRNSVVDVRVRDDDDSCRRYAADPPLRRRGGRRGSRAAGPSPRLSAAPGTDAADVPAHPRFRPATADRRHLPPTTSVLDRSPACSPCRQKLIYAASVSDSGRRTLRSGFNNSTEFQQFFQLRGNLSRWLLIYAVPPPFFLFSELASNQPTPGFIANTTTPP